MQSRYRLFLFVISAFVATSFFLCAPTYAQSTAAQVASVSITGTLTYITPTQGDAVGTMTINITRTPEISNLYIEVIWFDSTYLSGKYLVDALCDNGGGTKISCGGQGGAEFPPGVTTMTVTQVFGQPVISGETATVTARASYGWCPACGDNILDFNDPGISTTVTVQPITLSASVTPSTVSPGGSSPELTVTTKNSLGHIVRLGPQATSTCNIFNGQTFLFDVSKWDLSNPNVSEQYQLSIIQPPTTESCSIQIPFTLPDGTLTATPIVTFQEPLSSADLGPSFPRSGCEGMCGLPINLTNGNTWVPANDYALPGLGGGISLARTWNSQWISYSPPAIAGMFGDSWQSTYEKNIQVLSGGKQIRDSRGDGSIWFFTLNKTAWVLTSPTDERATLTSSSKTGYSLTLRDGSVELYNTNGFLTALQDRNGNQVTITYDGSTFNRISKVTDAAARVLQFNYGNSVLPKQVTSVQDSTGTIATYNYDTGSRLLSVTYADASIINYNYDANELMLSVTDQQGKILESHTYDGFRRGTSSQRANGVDALTITYSDPGATASTTLFDSKNNPSTYNANTKIANRY